MKKTRIVIALGGNAIQNKGEKGTFEEQYANVEKTMEAVVSLIKNNSNEVIITHGNGPQVGTLMVQQSKAVDSFPEMPMHLCGAMTQGQIGYLIQQSLHNLFIKNKINKQIVTVVTQTVVDKDSDGFKHPSKPVGSYFSKSDADKITKEMGYVFKEDAGRGWRRVVPSPLPIRLVEEKTIGELVDKGEVVIASGGGGIPVIEKMDKLIGVDAVIDKDRAAALMAGVLHADILIILTAVDKVCLNYGKKNEKKLDIILLSDAKRYLKEGHFAAGSMGPKIEAAISFIEKNKVGKVIITHAHSLEDALGGKGGTIINFQ